MAADTQKRKTYPADTRPADKARQEAVILNTRMRQLVCFGGWVSLALALLALSFILAAL